MLKRIAFGFLAIVSCLAQTDSPVKLGPLRTISGPEQTQILVELPVQAPVKPQDFALIEDGVTTATGKTLKGFRNAGWGVAYVLALDTSRSLRPKQLDPVKRAAMDFVTQVKDPKALVTFGEKALTLCPMTATAKDLTAAIGSLEPAGNRTVLYEAIDRSLSLFENRPALERHRIILVSDGAEDSRERLDFVDQVISRAVASRVAIDTIWIPTASVGARNTLVRLSERTGGFHADAAESTQILAAMSSVVDVVERAMVVSFARKLDSSGALTNQVGVSVAYPGIAAASMPAHITRSAPVVRVTGWSWQNFLHNSAAVMTDLRTLLAALIGIYSLYTASYLTVKKVKPEQITRFPFPPYPDSDYTRIKQESTKTSSVGEGGGGHVQSPVKPRIDRLTRVGRGSEPLSPRALTLKAVKGPLLGKVIPIDKANFRIGAEPENDLSIADDFISGQHAEIRAAESGWMVYDRGSLNGTYVDGSKLGEGPGQILRPGQTVRFGQSEFEVIFQDDRAAAASAAPLSSVR